MLQLSLLGVGTVLRLGNDAWSMVKRLRQATNEYAPPLPPLRLLDSSRPRNWSLSLGIDASSRDANQSNK